MYAIAFDLVVSDTQKSHPKGISQAYAEIGLILSKYSFWRVRAAYMLLMTKTWQIFLWRYNPLKAPSGFLNQSEISVHSVLSNGQILQRW